MNYYMVSCQDFSCIEEARAFQTMSPSVIRETEGRYGKYVLYALSRAPTYPDQPSFEFFENDEIWMVDLR